MVARLDAGRLQRPRQDVAVLRRRPRLRRRPGRARRGPAVPGPPARRVHLGATAVAAAETDDAVRRPPGGRRTRPRGRRPRRRAGPGLGQGFVGDEVGTSRRDCATSGSWTPTATTGGESRTQHTARGESMKPSTTSSSTQVETGRVLSITKCPTRGASTELRPWRAREAGSVDGDSGLTATSGTPASDRAARAARAAASLVTARLIASRAISGGADAMSAATHSTRAGSARSRRAAGRNHGWRRRSPSGTERGTPGSRRRASRRRRRTLFNSRYVSTPHQADRRQSSRRPPPVPSHPAAAPLSPPG